MSKKDLRDPQMIMYHLLCSFHSLGSSLASRVKHDFRKGVAFAEARFSQPSYLRQIEDVDGIKGLSFLFGAIPQFFVFENRLDRC